MEYAVPRQCLKRCCSFLLRSGGLNGPAHPLLRMPGVVSGGMGGSRHGHLLPHLPLPRRDQSELEGGRPPGLPEGSLESPGEVLCLGLVSTAEAWGLGPGLEQAAAARGGGGQPPPRPRGGSLPLPDVLIWATGSALSEEPRGRAPARLSGRSSKSKSLRRRRQAPVLEP